jgi:two-component system sensor histidine kinase HydH
VRECWDLVLPLRGTAGWLGWIAVGGPVPGRYLNEEVAAACTAVANQTAATLERLAALERARQRATLAAVGELAAGLAHEIRNPVAAIRGAGQAMGSEATPRQREEMLEVIAEESSRLDRVVGEFLAYARPEPPGRDPVDLSRIVTEALRSARAAGLDLRDAVRVAPGTPRVAGDAERIRRVIDNLLRNAHEAAGDGVTLRITIEPASARSVCLTVEDDGPGIPDEELARVLRPFHTTKTQGTGLGLSLAQRIVEAHGGEMAVDRGSLGGARIRITLPEADRA